MQQSTGLSAFSPNPAQPTAISFVRLSASSTGFVHCHLRAHQLRNQHLWAARAVAARHPVHATTGDTKPQSDSQWLLSQHAQSRHALMQLFSSKLHQRPPRCRGSSNAQACFAGGIAAAALQPLSAVRSYTGERMLQLNTGTRHLNPFTEVVYQRGPRRWLGLKKGHLIRAERPAPWLLELQQHLLEVPQRLQNTWQQVCSGPQHLESFLRHHVTTPNVLIMVAVAASVVLLLLLVARFFQEQQQEVRPPKEDPGILARKAASLDLQRSRFRRALGAEEDSAADPASPTASMPSTTTTAATDALSSDRENFEAWDEDTQKQWKRFMQSSRSQEIEEEQWWDIDRDELPPDRKVFQDFN